MMTRLTGVELPARRIGESPTTALPSSPPPSRAGDDRPARERYEQMFLAHWQMIQLVLASTARRQRLPDQEIDDFIADAVLRIMKDDFALLRKFRHDCTLRTFFATVADRMCRDYRTALWGKWRPSVNSRRHGKVAVLLEQLTVRDGLSFEEACTVLEINYRLPIDRKALSRLHAGFRARLRPRRVPDVELDEIPEIRPGDSVTAASSEVVAGASEALSAVYALLPPGDRQLVRLHYCEAMSIAGIARALGLDQKPLYSRMKRLIARLKEMLESRGVNGAEVLLSLGRGDGNHVEVFKDRWTGERGEREKRRRPGDTGQPPSVQPLAG
jgi:RNA polymerase sigma factor (sigma-70 family)